MASSPQPFLIKSSPPRHGTGGQGSSERNHYPIVETSADSSGSSNPTSVLDATALYPNVDDGPMVRAQHLIGECLVYLKKADDTPPANQIIDYDASMIRARHAFRQLFELRQLGDGFGATINGLLCSLHNGRAERLTAKQFAAIYDVLRHLMRRPMLHFDSANDLLDQLEDVGLDIEPPFVEQITGFLDE